MYMYTVCTMNSGWDGAVNRRIYEVVHGACRRFMLMEIYIFCVERISKIKHINDTVPTPSRHQWRTNRGVRVDVPPLQKDFVRKFGSILDQNTAFSGLNPRYKNLFARHCASYPSLLKGSSLVKSCKLLKSKNSRCNETNGSVSRAWKNLTAKNYSHDLILPICSCSTCAIAKE